ALNALHTYSLIQIKTENSNTERLLIAKELLESSLSRYGLSEVVILAEYQKENLTELSKLKLQHPIYADKTIPLIFGDHVTLDTGTGAVHTAPAHGLDDYLIGLE